MPLESHRLQIIQKLHTGIKITPGKHKMYCNSVLHFWRCFSLASRTSLSRKPFFGLMDYAML